MPPSKFPARVHIILAREARTAIAIRRGPSKAVCTMLWDRRTDTFRLGQWLRGRIYERRCDLSPDGKHFLYFAMNGRRNSEMKGSWTAVSRVPWLQAIGLWANGSCWNGGGLFMTNNSYWLNVPVFGHEPRLQPRHMNQHESHPFHAHYGGECPGVYYIRLQRDGWKLLGHHVADGEEIATFEKRLPKGWILKKFAHASSGHPAGAGCYFDRHEIVHSGRPQRLECDGWEWADLDGDRVVWIARGVLHASRLNAEGLASARRLHDFNPMEFEAIAAPRAAVQHPARPAPSPRDQPPPTRRRRSHPRP